MSAFAIQIQRNLSYSLYLKYPSVGMFDLSGWSLQFEARNKAGGDTVLFSYTEASPELEVGSFTVEGETYNIKIAIDDSVTALMPKARGVAQLKGIDTGGDDFEILPITAVVISEAVVA